MNGMIIARGNGQATTRGDPTGRGRQGVTHQPRGAGSPLHSGPFSPILSAATDPQREHVSIRSLITLAAAASLQPDCRNAPEGDRQAWKNE